MKMERIITIVVVLLAVTVVFLYAVPLGAGDFERKSFEGKRSEILSEIELTLREAVESGKYKCCIEPPCKMCFLGHWIWEDGTCDCDTLIAEGDLEQVCPECKAGIKEGRCTSMKTDTTCPVFGGDGE